MLFDERSVGIISRSTAKTMFSCNPFDLSAYPFGRPTHADCTYVTNSCMPDVKPLSQDLHYDYFYNLDNIFTRLFNYTERNKLNHAWHFE